MLQIENYKEEITLNHFHEYKNDLTFSTYTGELRHGKDKGKQITWANLPNAKADISFS